MRSNPRFPAAGPAAAALLAALVFSGCATRTDEVVVPSIAPAAAAQRPAPAQARYRCDHDIAFTVHFSDGAATLDAGPRGTETLMRDAGGTTEQQSVYSSTSVKAEFGLGPDGRGAVLHYAEPAVEAHCEREAA